MNYYSFHIGDFIAATVHLSPMEELAYRRLLDMYYDTESCIPLETQSVSRRLRLDIETVETVLNEYFTRTENGWYNYRCDAEIAAYHHKVEVNKTNGKLGGRPKKTQRVILANPTETESKANQEPITNNQEEKHTPPAGDVVSDSVSKKTNPAKNDFDPRSAMIGIGLDAGLVDDFLKVRKAKRAPTTRTALNGIVDEAKKAGWTFEQAIRACCSNNWQGFKAEWVMGKTPPNVTSLNTMRESHDEMMARLREDYGRQQEAWTVPVGSLQ